ncbi:MAG: hypothetical protein A3C53_04305 [Omnitrophica WOR_2 bacterium RIFCSPHIGHO2_02_FULL_68_15]|nr:MAG: hypothetical protein A3C53_04305 [Omnitrophica WOR_2 bacterium RIFCSPHIGHO2_02_FULL_68_15]
MPRWWDRVVGRLALIRQLCRFLWVQRLWWLIPFVGILLVVGLLLLVAQQTVLAPFLYTLF